MAIKNLSNKVSSDDVERTKDIRNPPKFEPGFEDDDIEGLDDLFDDLDDDFGSSGNSNEGGTSSPFGASGASPFGASGASPFGASGASPFGAGGASPFGAGGASPFGAGGASPFGAGGASPFGAGGASPFGAQQQVNKPQEPDLMDKACQASGEAALCFSKVLVEMFESIKLRTSDDIGYLNRNIFIVGVTTAVVSLVISILAAITKIRFISIMGLTGQVLVASILMVGSGLIGLAVSAVIIQRSSQDYSENIDIIPDVKDLMEEDFTDDYEENMGDILDDLFGDDGIYDDLFDDIDIGEEKEEEVFKSDFENIDFSEEPVDYSAKLEELVPNRILNRELLFNTFKTFFQVNTPSFSTKSNISVDSEEFATIETICLKALSNVCKCEMEEVKSKLESAEESYFSYELRLKRIRGVNKVDEIAREMEVYFRESSTDTSVNATVDIEGDFYKITITKGVNAVVTFGDIFRQEDACNFFLDTSNKLPVIVGINEIGEVILEDAKPFDTMLIAGKPRSGKSWYVLSVLLSLMMFNSPEDVQFVICDPKKSNLFNTLALMPHVIGLNDDSNILEVMKDIIDNEGDRRKKLLADNRCDDIWALKKKGINLPILYLVIDEVITVKGNLKDGKDKEFDSLMQVMISQLPFLGIRLIFVPHRATGVVNKTNRTMLQFTAAVRSNPEDVCDTLDIKKWKRPLINQGDVAIKLSTRQDAMYVRGAAVTNSDEDNADLIVNAARAFYKMGVDVSDFGKLSVAANRDEDYVRKELSLNRGVIQYDINDLDDDTDI